MRFLPLFLDLSAGTVALVGGGSAAASKLRILREAGAHVRWYQAGGGGEMAPDDAVEIVFDDPLRANFAEFIAVVSAAGHPIDQAVAARARTQNIPVNVVDHPALSSFIFPAVVNRGAVSVAISTGGFSPVLARRIREQIEALLPARIGELAALLGRFRYAFAQARLPSQSLRRFWEGVIDGPIGAAALAGRSREAEAGLARAVAASRECRQGGGIVHLVGAGPGDPDLLTLRALHALQNADIVFYDQLVAPVILTRARREAERVFVGKRRGGPGLGQDDINRRLAEAARAGRNVVCLKGGDAFMFGRAGEELDYLRRRGITTTVVPGILASLDYAADAGLALTCRKEASRLCLITSNRAEDAAATKWSGLVDPQTTVAVYMGFPSSAEAVRDGLIEAGRDPKTPAAAFAYGTCPDAKHAVGTLDGLAALAASVGGEPVLLVIGDAVVHSQRWRRAEALREIAA